VRLFNDPTLSFALFLSVFCIYNAVVCLPPATKMPAAFATSKIHIAVATQNVAESEFLLPAFKTKTNSSSRRMGSPTMFRAVLRVIDS
jgi:hypothetical protein